MKHILPITLLLISGSCIAVENTDECIESVKSAISQAVNDCDACMQAASADHANYQSLLQQASSNEGRGLQRFFQYAEESTLIGAGAEEMACHMKGLLLIHGDKSFSTALASQKPKVREAVIGMLDHAYVPAFKKRYPKTYRLAMHDPEL